MTGRTHSLVAVSVAFTAGNLADVHGARLGVLVGGAFLTARLPDADIALGLPHRGVTHYALTCLAAVSATVLACSLVVPAWKPVAGTAIAIGLASHLILDAMTRSGIPVWGPFSTRPVHLLPRGFRVLTGGAVECVLFWALTAAVILWVLHWTRMV